MKVGIGILHLVPFSAWKFHENWAGKNRALFVAVNEFFHIFLPNWVNLRTEDVLDLRTRDIMLRNP